MLLAAFIGGVAFFFGPILGAVVFVFFAVALSEYTKAWQLYLGVFFVLLVMYAPGGLSSLILMNLRVLKFKKFARLRDPYFGLLLAALALAFGVVLIIELMYHVTLNVGQGPEVRLFGFSFDTTRAPGGSLPFRHLPPWRPRSSSIAGVSSSNGTMRRSRSKTGSAKIHEQHARHSNCTRSASGSAVPRSFAAYLCRSRAANATRSSARTVPANRRCST